MQAPAAATTLAAGASATTGAAATTAKGQIQAKELKWSIEDWEKYEAAEKARTENAMPKIPMAEWEERRKSTAAKP
eukprot:2872143-Amphidinium_carterae.1